MFHSSARDSDSALRRPHPHSGATGRPQTAQHKALRRDQASCDRKGRSSPALALRELAPWLRSVRPRRPRRRTLHRPVHVHRQPPVNQVHTLLSNPAPIYLAPRYSHRLPRPAARPVSPALPSRIHSRAGSNQRGSTQRLSMCRSTRSPASLRNADLLSGGGCSRYIAPDWNS